jgi:predicted alpha/beta hydrolase
LEDQQESTASRAVAAPDQHGDASRGVLVFVPALGAPARVYGRFATMLAEHGFGVMVVELRGVGRSTAVASRQQDWGYADLVDDEVAGAVKAARERWPGRRLWLGGHSLGGHLALLHQARHALAAADGLLLIASGTPYWRRYPGLMAWGTRFFGRIVHWSCRAFGYFPGHRLGFGGRQPASLMLDWAAFLETGRPMARGWPDERWREVLRDLQRPTLALHVAGDRYAPRAAVAHLLSLTSIVAQPLTVDERDKPGHFGWLKRPEAVIDAILAWRGTST